jgi:hypothetical protein
MFQLRIFFALLLSLISFQIGFTEKSTIKNADRCFQYPSTAQAEGIYFLAFMKE